MQPQGATAHAVLDAGPSVLRNEQATVEALLDLATGLPEIGAVDAVTATVPR